MRFSIDYLGAGVNEEGGPFDCGREGLLGVDHNGDFAMKSLLLCVSLTTSVNDDLVEKFGDNVPAVPSQVTVPPLSF